MRRQTGKKIGDSPHKGDAGVALVHRRVNEMGFIWHERNQSRDGGIDGQIELRDPTTGEIFGRHIGVQSKARRRFAGERGGGETFHFLCDPDDIEYWMGSDWPVIMVCSHPVTQEAWWVDVKGCFSDPQRRAERKLHFSKRTDGFDADAAVRLLDLAKAEKSGFVPPVRALHEKLISNLLEVTGLPPIIYAANTVCRKTKDVFDALRANDVDIRYDWILVEKQLYLFSDPAETGFRKIITEPVDVFDTADWSESADLDERRRFVNLLNVTLRQDLSGELDWFRKKRYLFFRAPADLKEMKVPSETGRLRAVFVPKPGRKVGVGYYWHAALESRFQHLDDRWYLCILPSYHFTHNGVHVHPNRAELLAGIKRIESNSAVFGFTRMWAEYLRGDAAEVLFDPKERMIEFGQLLSLDADRGIDDNAWAPPPHAGKLGDQLAFDILRDFE